MILHVGYQRIREGKQDEVAELNVRWDAFEKRLGFPLEKRYSCQFGAHDSGTVLSIREWESMAVMEATYERAMADPELQQLFSEVAALFESGSKWELYQQMP